MGTSRHELSQCKIDANFHRVVSDEIDKLLLLTRVGSGTLNPRLGSLSVSFHTDDEGLPIVGQPFMTITINEAE